jgi:hypothetical protein
VELSKETIMAQAGFTPIQLYFSTTAAAVPTAGNLANGELAINITDGKLYYKNNSGVVTLLAGATAGPAGGSNTQVQFNSSGALAGSANLTFNGTTLTANALTVTNAVTLSGGTANGVLYLNGSKVATSGSAFTFDGAQLAVLGTAGDAVNMSSSSATNTLIQITNQNASKDLIQRFRQQGGAGNWFDITMVGSTNNLTFDYNDGFLATLTNNGDFVVGRTSANLTSANRGVIELNGTSTAYYGIDTGGTLRGTWYSNGSKVGLATLASIPLTFETTAGTEYGRFNTNGFFGIGNTNPNTPLTVYGASGSFKQLELNGGSGTQILYAGSVADAVGSYMQNNAYYENSFTFMPVTTSSSGIHYDGDGSMWLSTNSGLTVGTAFTPSDRLRILPSGYVGINKTTPIYTLDVNSGATSGVVARLASALGGTNNNVQMIFSANSTTLWQIGANVGASSNTDRFEFYNTNISGAVVAGITPSGQAWFGNPNPSGGAILQAFGTGEGAYISVNTNGVGLYLNQSGSTSDVIFRTSNTSTNFWDYQMNKPSLGNTLQIDYNDNAVITFNTDRTIKISKTLGVGDTNGSSSGAGITFPASVSLSSDVNTLDDYEEGTFTPTLAANGGGSITIMTQVGKYTKIGNMVTCTFWIQYSGSTLSGSTVSMTGLPFAKDSSGVRPSPAIRAMGFSSYTNVIGGWLPDASTSIVLNYFASGSSNDVPGSAVPGGGEYGGTISYQTNS